MVDKNSKLNDEKRLTEFIRKAHKKEFVQQEKKKIANFISGNFSITTQKIAEVKKEVLDLRKCIGFI